jgi:hypothetical protein
MNANLGRVNIIKLTFHYQVVYTSIRILPVLASALPQHVDSNKKYRHHTWSCLSILSHPILSEICSVFICGLAAVTLRK